ncbi:uncharacterized protein MELLADRAFT_109756 [Melampsora larici-populina 98AG31]|uniref:Secreted protein n=1 Tax=Melampsora larici-populina (strain 98AG31 / pathotype 3-4-7) TaxID=747676 RepID=F4RXH9_MELLP|nr:uncharacterized protein MELLADRAFT_109756 [Melampsora larici-populina 98AG31]EGG02968.1 hypothetical protein MELLADRAFT_109756 [Melampsora larici-populina 98AG31]
MKMRSLRIFAPYALLILCGLVNWTHSNPTPMTESDVANLVADESLSDGKFVTTGVNHGRTADPSSQVLERVEPESAKTNENFKSLAGDDARGSQTNHASKPKTPAQGEKKTFLQKLRSFFADGPVKVRKKIKQWFSKAKPSKYDKKKVNNPKANPKKDLLYIPEPKTSAVENSAKEKPNDSSVHVQQIGNKKPQEEFRTPTPRIKEASQQDEFFASDRSVKDWEEIENMFSPLSAFDESEEVKGSQHDVLAFINGRIHEVTAILEKPETIPSGFPMDQEFLKTLQKTMEDEESQYRSSRSIVEKAKFTFTKEENKSLHTGWNIIILD